MRFIVEIEVKPALYPGDTALYGHAALRQEEPAGRWVWLPPVSRARGRRHAFDQQAQVHPLVVGGVIPELSHRLSRLHGPIAKAGAVACSRCDKPATTIQY